MKGRHIPYSEAETRFLKSVAAFPRVRVTKWFNLLFQRNLTVKHIQAKLLRMGYHCATNGQFTKGGTPWNKGKKNVMPRPTNAFKKGCKALNRLPVGSTRISKEGHVILKIAEPDIWITRSRLVYCQHHQLDHIPEGYVIWHKNGNSQDDRPENLALISRGELMLLCKFKHKQHADELKPSVELLAKLKYKKFTKQSHKKRSLNKITLRSR